MAPVVGFLTWLGSGSAVLGAAKVIVFAASVAYSASQNRKMKKALNRAQLDLPSEMNGRTTNFKESAQPRRIIYGRCKVGGPIFVLHQNGAGGNEYTHLVIGLAGHEINSIDEVYADDQQLTLDSNGDALGRYLYVGASHIHVEKLLGHPDQKANAYMMANMPEIWTANHRLRETACVYIRVKRNVNLFPNGLPVFTVVVRGKKVFDPRISRASRITFDGGLGNTPYIGQTNFAPATTGSYCFSCWVKAPAGTTRTGRILIYDQAGGNSQETAITITDQWQRVSVPISAVSGHLYTSTLSLDPLASDFDIYAFGAQINSGTTPGGYDFTQATATDYNLVKYSEEFASWDDSSDLVVVNDGDTAGPQEGQKDYAANPALCLADFLCDEKLGIGANYSQRINEAELIASANNCDEDVTVIGGVQNRYEAHGTIDTSTDPQDIIENLAGSMAGSCPFIGGRWHIMSGYYRTPVEGFGDDEIIEELKIQTRLSKREIFNRVKGVYVSAFNDWQISDFPPYKNATYLAQDDGHEIWNDLQLNFTIAASMAQRLAKIQLERVRQQITVTAVGKLSLFRFKCGDVVPLTNARQGWTNKPFEITRMDLKQREDQGAPLYYIEMVLRETASTVFDWDMGEETEVDPAPDTDLEDPLAIPAPTSVTAVSEAIQQSTGDFVARIRLSWTASQDQRVRSGGFTHIQFRKDGVSNWTDWSRVPGTQEFDIITDLQLGDDYEFRVRHISSSNTGSVESAWASPASVTRADGDTVAPGDITNLAGTGSKGQIVWTWTNPADNDLREIELFIASASTPAPTGSSLPNFLPGLAQQYHQTGLPGSATRYCWARAVDRSGNLGDWVGPVSATTEAAAVAVTVELSQYSLEDVHDGGGHTFPDTYIGGGGTGTAITATASGGTGPYTYFWEIFEQSSWSPGFSTFAYIFADEDDDNPTYFRVPDSMNDGNYYAKVRCRATDSLGNVGISPTLEIHLLINPP